MNQPYRVAISHSWPSVDIVGEAFHRAEIVAAVGRRPRVDEEVEVIVEATLVPEPDNPYDPDAISVRINGYPVGHLDRQSARDYKSSIRRVTASGFRATTQARVWMVTRHHWESGQEQLHANIRLALSEPHQVLALNEPIPDAHSMIPWGTGLQVTGEEK